MILDDLNDRDWAILRSRLADESLEVSAARFSISRERVRQIESYVDRRVGRRLCAELRKGHPAAIGLGAHLGRLALTVTDAASKEQGKLLIEDRQDWIRKALPPDEALIMGAVERSLETLAPEDQSLLDHLSRVGQPLAGGRTTLPPDFQFNALIRLDVRAKQRGQPIRQPIHRAWMAWVCMGRVHVSGAAGLPGRQAQPSIPWLRKTNALPLLGVAADLAPSDRLATRGFSRVSPRRQAGTQPRQAGTQPGLPPRSLRY